MKNKSPLLLIFLVVFIDLLGFGIVIPILPYYAQAYGAKATTLGLLMMSYSAMQFLFSPVWGRLSDHIGRRPVLLISILGNVFALVVLGLAPSLLWLFVGRILSGICGANISTAMAYIADITPPENRAKGMGIIGAGFGLGFIFGPAIGGVLSKYGYNVPILFAAFIAFLNFIFATFRLAETPLSRELRAQNRTRRFDIKSITEAFHYPHVRSAILLFFVVTFAFTQMEVTFAYFMSSRFGYDAHKTGWLLAFIGTIMVFIQGTAIGKLAKRFGEVKLVLIGTFLMGCGLVFTTQAFQPIILLFALGLVGVGNAINNPSLSSLASQNAPTHKQGMILGVYQSAGSLARVFGPIVAGMVYDGFGITKPFLLSAILMFIASFGCLMLFTNTRTRLNHSFKSH